MAKVSAPMLGTLGVFVLLWVAAPQVLQFGLVLLAGAFATALSAVLVLTVLDLAGPTKTDSEGRVLGLRDRWRLHLIGIRNIFLARPWRNPAGVRRAAMRSVARVRVARPAGAAAAEHICVSANPTTLEQLDEYQAIEETAWDIGEKYRHATQGQPAAGPEVSIWVFADPDLPRGFVRVRAALRQPVRTDCVAHATVALTPGDLMPRGVGARPAPGQVSPRGYVAAPASPAPASTAPASTAPASPAPASPPSTAPASTAPASVARNGAGGGTAPSAPANAQTAVLPRPGTTAAPSGAPGNPGANPTFAPSGVTETVTFGPVATPLASSPEAPTSSTPPIAQLLDAAGNALGKPVPLPDGTKLTVGRDPQSGIVVPDVHVSRSHLQLRASGGRVWVRDLGSRGGTEVSGRRLAAGDEIAVPIGTMIGLSPQPKDGRPAVSVRIG